VDSSPTPTRAERAGWFRDPVLRLLVIGSLLNAVAFFGTLPFLTLYLADISTLSPAAIGAAVGSVALIAAFGGFLGGVLTDRLGAVTLIRAGLVLYVLTYLALSRTQRVPLVLGLVLLLGVGRLMVEPSMKKLLSMAAAGTGSAVFRIRYVTLCLGAIVGPLVGAALYTADRDYIFVLPAAIFTVYFGLLSRNAAQLRAVDAPTGDGPPHWGLALRDRTLLLVIGGGLMVFFVFSQFESIVPLYIRSERGAAAVGYFAGLLATNAALGVAMQWPVERISRRVRTGPMALIGCLGFAVALLLFGLLPVSPAYAYLGVVAWTVGEAVLLPLPDVLIHDHTPADRRGAYFGLAELRYLGFFLGPAAGGALLAGGSWLLFGGMAAVALTAWPLLTVPARRIAGPPVGPAAPAAPAAPVAEPVEPALHTLIETR
jgi:MFS family permease